MVGVDTKEVGLHWLLLVPSALVKLVYLVDIGSFWSPLAGFGWQWNDLADTILVLLWRGEDRYG